MRTDTSRDNVLFRCNALHSLRLPVLQLVGSRRHAALPQAPEQNVDTGEAQPLIAGFVVKACALTTITRTQKIVCTVRNQWKRMGWNIGTHNPNRTLPVGSLTSSLVSQSNVWRLLGFEFAEVGSDNCLFIIPTPPNTNYTFNTKVLLYPHHALCIIPQTFARFDHQIIHNH